MSMTKTELRPEEGEPEEERADMHDPRYDSPHNPVEDRKDVRLLQRVAWDEGWRYAAHGFGPDRNPYRS